eukprot:tig00000615_g2561.t1
MSASFVSLGLQAPRLPTSSRTFQLQGQGAARSWSSARSWSFARPSSAVRISASLESDPQPPSTASDSQSSASTSAEQATVDVEAREVEREAVEEIVIRADDLPTPSSDRRTQLVSFTCKKCNNEVRKYVNPAAIARGTVLIQCDYCGSRHALADNLGVLGYYMGADELASLGGEKIRRPNVEAIAAAAKVLRKKKGSGFGGAGSASKGK